MPRLRETPEERKKRQLRESIAASEARTDAYFRTGEIQVEAPPKTEADDASGADAADAELPEGVKLADFVAYMPTHSYIYSLTREMWPAASVNSRIDPVTLVDERANPFSTTTKRCKPFPPISRSTETILSSK
jgi:hypothetical protein